MRRQRGGALPAAGPVAGKDMVELFHQIPQFLGRKIGRRQASFFIGINVIGKARVAGFWAERDVRLAVPDEDDTHR